MPSVRFLKGGVLLLVCVLPGRAAAPNADQRRADALKLAAAIDRQLARAWAADQVVPAPPIDDAGFLRRVYLHLAGRIPSVHEVQQFLRDTAPDKRLREVEKLLAGHRYPLHLARVWRAMLLPEASAGSEARGFAPPLEAWLRSRFAAGVGYDRMVRELLTASAPRGEQALQRTLDLYGIEIEDGSSPLSLYQAKQFKPENLAEVAARMFLGIRLGCAQCHNHPTADWQREQFWAFAAFFAGAGRAVQPNQPQQPLPRELKIPDTDKIVAAAFLDGKAPAWKEKDDPRAVLAEWVTRKDNPYFARATVNRVWAYLFGTGIVDPVDEIAGSGHLPSHPELLDDLAREFAAHDFDLKFLIQAITASKVYQLSSARTHPSQDELRHFARAPLLGMTPEQLYDSVAEATGYGSAGAQTTFSPQVREEFLTRFSNLSDRPSEYQTSIIQALMLMNGRLTADATGLERSQLLGAVLASPFMDTNQRIETLYLATLSRKPREKELARLRKFIDDAVQSGGQPTSAEEREQRYKRTLADVFWALLNSGEFFFNR